jgi:hypothetical protein
LQTTIQVRNKLVSAYHDIMNMQVWSCVIFVGYIRDSNAPKSLI